MRTQLPFPKRGRSPLPNFWPMSVVAKWPHGSRWHLALVQATLCYMWMQLPSPKKGVEPPISGPFYCGQTAVCIKMPLGVEVGLSLGDFVLDGDPALIPQKGRSPQFSARVYCGQMATWIKMPRGTEVGLGLRNIVLDGDPAPPPLKGHSLPQFSGQCPLWPNDLMDYDATWYGGRPRPRRLCVRW